jgi:hypothetical protein
LGTVSISVPTKAHERDACVAYAKENHRDQDSCKNQETLWERGLSDPIAYETLWLALFTWALASVGVIQGLLSFEQIRLAHVEFSIKNRPRMRLRFVSGPEPIDDSRSEFQAYLANAGDSIAIVKSATFTAWTTVDGVEVQIELVPADTGIEPIEVGAGVLMRGIAKDWTGFDSVFCALITVTGRIVYEDQAGTSRITAFAREKTGPDGRFRVSEKYAADEYED